MQDSGYINMDVQVPALAFEYKDKPGAYIGEFDGVTTDLNDAILWANKDLSKPDKKECKRCSAKMQSSLLNLASGLNFVI